MGVSLLLSSCEANKLEKQIDNTLNRGVSQYSYMMKMLPKGKYPKTYYADKGKLATRGSEWWCSGFYPGTMLYLDEAVKSLVLETEIERILQDLKREQFNTTAHDLGFMMFCSFGNANRLNPKPEYIAEFILNHPNLPKDKVPYWDFNAPNIPDALRDSSAGAVMASALLELKNYIDKEASKKYFTVAKQL